MKGYIINWLKEVKKSCDSGSTMEFCTSLSGDDERVIFAKPLNPTGFLWFKRVNTCLIQVWNEKNGKTRHLYWNVHDKNLDDMAEDVMFWLNMVR